MAKKLLLVAVSTGSLSGCASERYLSVEEDSQMREACVQGCTVVPNAVLMELLKRQGTRI